MEMEMEDIFIEPTRVEFLLLSEAILKRYSRELSAVKSLKIENGKIWFIANNNDRCVINIFENVLYKNGEKHKTFIDSPIEVTGLHFLPLMDKLLVYELYQLNEEEFTFYCRESRVQVTWYKPRTNQSWLYIENDGQKLEKLELGANKRLHQRVDERVQEGFRNYYLKHLDCCTGPTINTLESKSCREIANVLLKEKVDLGERVKYSPAFKCINSSGLIMQDESNVWQDLSDESFMRLILREVNCSHSFNKIEIEYAEKYIECLKKTMKLKILDENFFKGLNSNLNLFALSDCVVDSSLGKIILRPIDSADKIYKITSNWAYSHEDAVTYYDDVSIYLYNLFPDASVRLIVLRYLARLLSGVRNEKAFLMFTDIVGGGAGKTSFKRFLLDFFGDYSSQDCNLFVAKLKTQHQASVQLHQYHRLIVGDEFDRSMTMDTTLLKQLFSNDEDVEGKTFRQFARFKHTWTAGGLMFFNKNCCPRFKSTESEFRVRALTCPMDLKFVRRSDSGVCESHNRTCVMDPNFSSRAKAWKSAFLAILAENYKNDFLEGIDELPIQMRDIDKYIFCEKHFLYEWFSLNLNVTCNPFDIVKAKTLYDWIQLEDTPFTITFYDLKKNFRKYCNHVGVDYVYINELVNGKELNNFSRGLAIKIKEASNLSIPEPFVRNSNQEVIKVVSNAHEESLASLEDAFSEEFLAFIQEANDQLVNQI